MVDGAAGTPVLVSEGYFALALALFQPDHHKELAFPQKARNCGPS
jgi:hypothetical protein